MTGFSLQKKIISFNGDIIPLHEYQLDKKLPFHYLNTHFTFFDKPLERFNIYAEALLELLEMIAQRDYQKPILGSAINLPEGIYSQKEGMFAYLHYSSPKQFRFYCTIIRDAIEEMGELIPGFGCRVVLPEDYHEEGSIYLDVMPMYYGFGRCWAHKECDAELRRATVSLQSYF